MRAESFLPNLFIVGGAKCGTTSLCRNLGKHPDIFLPNIKEPQYMVSKFVILPRKGPGDDQRDANMISDLDEYLALYENSKDVKYRIDGTVDMIYYPGVEKEIKKFNSEAKIIIVLRNPADRAYSVYKMLKNMYIHQREPLSFEAALEAEDERMNNNYEFTWAYKKCGLYYGQVKRFVDEFGWGSVKVVLLDDVERDSNSVYKEILDFLEVDYIDDLGKDVFNRSGQINNPGAFVKFKKIVKSKGILKRVFKMIFPNHQTRIKIYDSLSKRFISKNEERMSSETRKQLIDYFKDDIKLLSKLIKKDLSDWIV